MGNKFSPDAGFPGMSAARVLVLGHDRVLAGLRTPVLLHSGYDVEDAFSVPEALARAQSDSIDAILICHSVPDGEIEKLVTAVRKTRALMPIVCMRTHQNGFAPRTCVAVENTPAAILQALKSAVQGYKPGPASSIARLRHQGSSEQKRSC